MGRVSVTIGLALEGGDVASETAALGRSGKFDKLPERSAGAAAVGGGRAAAAYLPEPASSDGD